MVDDCRTADRRAILRWALCLAGLYAFFYQGGGWNQNARFDTVRALVERGNFEITYYMDKAWISHMLVIEMKEGRYRYTLSDFEFDNGKWSAPLEDEKKFTGQKKRLFKQVIAHAEATIGSLKGAMEAESEDW